jgi:hypothetical protein
MKCGERGHRTKNGAPCDQNIPVIYLPNGHGAGRRLCPDCVRVLDTLRAPKAPDA